MRAETVEVSFAREFVWRQPEWWTVALCGVAWTFMVVGDVQHAGHEFHHRMGFRFEVLHWVGMVAAMMLPLLLEQVRTVAVSSLWRRRHRAIGGFLLGFFAAWMMVGLAVAWVREFAWAHTQLAAAVAFLGAAWWLVTPWHLRGLKGCHKRIPLAPAGWRADWDCLRYGFVIGWGCVRSCWVLMAACALAGHGLVVMAGGMAVGLLERRYFQRGFRWEIVVAVGLAVWCIVW